MSTAGNLDSPSDAVVALRHAADARVESVLNQMTLDELSALQDTLFEQLRMGLPPADQIADALERHSADVADWFRAREPHSEAVEVVMLLVALAVAIAWLRHRGTPAPNHRLQDAIARVRDDQVYMLPIPRCDPCFCGSGSRFRACHGRPPMAVPAV
jgi:hypothetical protein